MRKLFFLTLILTTHAFTAPRPESLTSIANFVTGRQPVAPGCVTIARGAGFAESELSYSRFGELPTEWNGVRVSVGDIPAGLRYVAPTEVVFVMPLVRNYGWHLVTIRNADAREWRGWVYVARASLGVFLQNGYPQGEVQNGRGVPPCVIGFPNCRIINTGETRIRLLGTGFTYAPVVWAILIDAQGREWWIDAREETGDSLQPELRTEFAIGNFLGIAGVDYVSFKLPVDARGQLMLLFFAPGERRMNGSLSDAVWLTVD